MRRAGKIKGELIDAYYYSLSPEWAVFD